MAFSHLVIGGLLQSSFLGVNLVDQILHFKLKT